MQAKLSFSHSCLVIKSNKTTFELIFIEIHCSGKNITMLPNISRIDQIQARRFKQNEAGSCIVLRDVFRE